ncbi:alpha/beta fold hydrolase [Streptomyces avermitilis]|uniref:alpha/beta fold hydrolase n=1 Tax=Streptomyces avermitilis TaxID=33903 RepID=UPI003697E2CB
MTSLQHCPDLLEAATRQGATAEENDLMRQASDELLRLRRGVGAQIPVPAAVLLETVRGLGTLRGVEHRWRAELTTAGAKNPHPTLIIWGDRDRVLPARHLDSGRQLLPHAETQLFTGIGHMPQIECPDEFAGRVLAFLAGAQGPGQPGTAGPSSVSAQRTVPHDAATTL